MRKQQSSFVKTGISMGCALAVTISYVANKSILWAMLHGVCSWLYVIYYALFISQA